MRGVDLKKILRELLLLILHPRDRDSRSYLHRYAVYFPHIRFDHLGLGDVIRIPLQLLWLALVRTTPRPVFPLPRWKQRDWHWSARLHHWSTGNATGKIKRRTDQLRVRIGPFVEYLRQFNEKCARHRCWDYPVIRYSIYSASALSAFMCITIAFDMIDQLAFAALLLVIALIARLVSGQTITFFLVGLSIIASARYFWWRASSTLNLDGNVELAWGLVLIVAEFYVWLALLTDYLKAGCAVKRELLIQSDQHLFGETLIQICNELIDGIARVVFLTAPLALLLFDAYIIYAPVILLAIYVLPHFAHVIIASRSHGGSHSTFLTVVYKTVLSWCAVRRITAMFLNPRKGISNVAGGSAEKEYFDLNVSTLCILLMGLNLAGFVAGLNHLYSNPHGGIGIMLLNLGWVLYNLLFLGAAITIIMEFKKIETASLSKYGLRGMLAMCLMGYCYLGKSLFLCFSPVVRRLSRFGMVVGTYLPRSPKLLLA